MSPTTVFVVCGLPHDYESPGNGSASRTPTKIGKQCFIAAHCSESRSDSTYASPSCGSVRSVLAAPPSGSGWPVADGDGLPLHDRLRWITPNHDSLPHQPTSQLV